MKERNFQDILYHFYATFVVCVAFGCYMKTLAPTVSFFDSGELISAAYTLGVAHPPGYPLYVLLGWLFSKLPVGNVAYRLNLMSAVFASLASLMVYYITHTIITQRSRVRHNLSSGSPNQNSKAEIKNLRHPGPERVLYPIISMIAALTFAFSMTHWQQALITEVYSLNAFLSGLIILLLLKWHFYNSPPLAGRAGGRGIITLPRQSWLLCLVALVFGLGFGNHQTISLLFFPACFLVLMTAPRIVFNGQMLLRIGFFLLTGLSIYLLIPIRAAQSPPVNWGNAVTLRQFVWLVSREGYKNVPQGHALKSLWADLVGKEENSAASEVPEVDQKTSPAKSGTDFARTYRTITQSLFLKQLKSFHLLREFGYMGVAFAILGLLYGLAVHRVAGAALLIAVLSLVIIIVIISDAPEENIFLVKEFHTPAYLLVAVWLGLGMMAIARAGLWITSNSRSLRYVLVFVLGGYFLVLPGSQLLKNLKTVDRRRNYVAYDYASNVLNSLQPDAILFTWGDSGAFPVWYAQSVEGKRPDVTVVHTPHLSADWYVGALPTDLFVSSDPYQHCKGDLSCLISEIGRKNLFSRPIYFDYPSAHSIIIPYPVIPWGVTYKLALPGEKLDKDIWSQYTFRGIFDNTRIAMDHDIKRIFLMYGSAHVELGHYYMKLGQPEKAEREFNIAVRFAPELSDRIVRKLRFRDKIIDNRSGYSPNLTPISQ